jgi:predicted AAA+ superfamily ATPase
VRRTLQNNLTDWFNAKKRKPLVLRGARQVGKSSLVRLFAKEIGLELDEINLEQQVSFDAIFKTLDMSLIEAELSSFFHRPVGRRGSLLFLDEIQATPHGLAALRYFYEQRPDIPVIAAGSLLEFALSEAKFSMPVGRIDFLHVEPMSFEEFLLAAGAEFLVDRLHSYHVGDLWPEQLHTQLMRRLREYLMIGGMPEVVEAFVMNSNAPQWSAIQESILQTYREDFHKYGKRAKIMLMHEIFSRIPGFVGRKIKYSDLAPDERSSTTRDIMALFHYARVIRKAFHTDGHGLPIGASADLSCAKLFFVDVGLACHGLGVLPRSTLFDDDTIWEGQLAEQFVAQHIATIAGGGRTPELYYWKREQRQSNSEIDFLVQHDRWIIPVEVKAGTTGSLRSLHQYMVAHPKTPLAIKLCAQPPLMAQSQQAAVTAMGTKTYPLKLLTLPLYMTGQLHRLINEVI